MSVTALSIWQKQILPELIAFTYLNDVEVVIFLVAWPLKDAPPPNMLFHHLAMEVPAAALLLNVVLPYNVSTTLALLKDFPLLNDATTQ